MSEPIDMTSCDVVIASCLDGGGQNVEEWKPVVVAAHGLIREILQRLVPLLEPVCTARVLGTGETVSAAKVCEKESVGILFITESGSFYRVVGGDITSEGMVWEMFPLGDVIQGLLTLIDSAEIARNMRRDRIACHLEIIHEVTEVLKKK